jgi:hypothetical protein
MTVPPEESPNGPADLPEPQQRHPPRRRRSGPVRLVIALTLAVTVAAPLAGVAFAVTNSRAISDWITATNYSPTAAMAELVSSSGMNGAGTRLFYASTPELNEADAFNAACGIRPEQYLLGCYTGTKIHLYDIVEARLSGIREVTAAHEMLHAGYDRLDAATKERVGVLLEQAYAEHGDDSGLASRMAAYEVSQPGTRLNELHSIIGTEFTSLDPELEQYYTRYFSDRSKVVALHTAYAAVFSDIEAKSADLSSRLLALADGIDTEISTYNADITRLNSDIKAFNDRNAAFGYSGNEAGFNRDKARLQSTSTALDATLGDINAKQGQLADLRTQLQAIDADAQALNRSINSTFVPSATV